MEAALASSPRDVMLANLQRRQAQAEAAEAGGDRPAADAHWRAVQSHAKSLAPYDPDVAVPILEAVMCRFEALAAEAASQGSGPQAARRADLYHGLSPIGMASNDKTALRASR
jgi:hypothetical protein